MFRILTLIFAFTALISVNVYAGGSDIRFMLNDTDAEHDVLVGVFDLRDRETFIQLTLTDGTGTPEVGDTLHVQIFNLAQSCGENNFFDSYTLNDTHLYDMRNIVTNDGNDPGFILPDDSYGFVVINFHDSEGIGNLRIKDVNGYEYRTNLQAAGNDDDLMPDDGENDNEWWFNFNTEEGVILSDIFGVMMAHVSGNDENTQLAPITEIWMSARVEILDLNEVLFSCTDVVWACTDGTDPLIPDLLEDVADEEDSDIGQVQAGAEWGINETIPSSRGARNICPNNTVSAGTLFLNEEDSISTDGSNDDNAFVMFVGLNNGNGRGSFDSAWAGESAFPESD